MQSWAAGTALPWRAFATLCRFTSLCADLRGSRGLIGWLYPSPAWHLHPPQAPAHHSHPAAVARVPGPRALDWSSVLQSPLTARPANRRHGEWADQQVRRPAQADRLRLSARKLLSPGAPPEFGPAAVQSQIRPFRLSFLGGNTQTVQAHTSYLDKALTGLRHT